MTLLTGNVWIDLLAIIVALATILVAYVKWSFTYWDRKGVPYVAPTFLVGNIKDLLVQKSSFGDCFAKLYDVFKESDRKFFGGYFLTRPMIIIMDPELIKHVMTKDFDFFVDRPIYSNEQHDPLSAHLFSLQGTRWRNLRVKLTPTFTLGKMKMMFQTLVDCSDGLINILQQSAGNAVDIKDVVGRFTTDVIGSCAFGLDCNSLKDPDTKFRIYGKKIFSLNLVDAMKAVLGIIVPEVLRFFNATIINKDVSKFFIGIVRETIDYREKNNVNRKDFMNLLMQLKNTGKLDDDEVENEDNGKFSETSTKLTFEQIAAQSFLFFAAGFETSSTTLTFCLYELVKNVDLQENLRREIEEVLDRHDGKITYEGLMEMKYMDNVINETLRKYPPVPVLTRICNTDYSIPHMDFRVRKGQSVFIPVLAIQHDSKHYPDPEKFDPDRFSEKVKRTRHTYAFLPFGEGPRNCIGLKFGVMQTKVALTVLLKNFKFTMNNKTKEPLRMDPKSFIMSVTGGVWLNTTKIQNVL